MQGKAMQGNLGKAMQGKAMQGKAVQGKGCQRGVPVAAANPILVGKVGNCCMDACGGMVMLPNFTSNKAGVKGVHTDSRQSPRLHTKKWF